MIYHHKKVSDLSRVCMYVPVRAEHRSWCLWRKISHAEVLNCELPIVPFSSIYRNYTT